MDPLSLGSPRGNGREPLLAAFLYEVLPGNECHRKFIVEDIVSSCRSLVTLSCRLYSLGSYSQETNKGCY